ncbi:YcnI family copper-binding membrane protein [Alicyclobacillus dauci]|uniref:DUF1775 domain-containing protein n=1 Tax=Alicyclobacillus dauci TaxID=1475485 RepID=A0ABY6Z9P4_9BACL|nr:DUF1775 domain-containing protein [Alicyclobacillus dauci]WAH38810.1 DUF1775 domain-containing protein [Alicyclobacillus dauci]
MNRIQKFLTGSASAFATLAITTTAFAHVIVTPAQSTVGAWEKYTMRVPCEKTDPTWKIVLKIPNGVEFEQYEPVPGWTVQTQKSGQSGETVTWSTSGTGIQPGQFDEFSFVAKNPTSPTKVAWDAYQYYKDGTIVEWTGDEGSSTPHSFTNILSGQPAAQSAPSSTPSTTTAPVANGLGWTMADTWVLAVSVVSLLLSGLAIGLSLKRNGDE